MERLVAKSHYDYHATPMEKLASIVSQPKNDTTNTARFMEWNGRQTVSIASKPSVAITEPGDAIVRILATTVCGSDLHLYDGGSSFGTGLSVGMKKGMTLGHEAIGVIDKVGPNVTKFKPGDRVIISSVISCGTCAWCKRGEMSCCANTNPSPEMDKVYGGRTAALFGYSELTGAYPGLQAEVARVPLADVNLFTWPAALPLENALLLSDVACTAWHGNELAGVEQGDNVAIWGAGPIGMVTAMWAKFRGAARVVVIDNVPYRLEMIKSKLGVDTINFQEVDPVKRLKEMFPLTDAGGGGPDACIDCAGFRFTSADAMGLLNRIERVVGLETDAPNIVNEMIHAVRMRGRLAIIGDYFNYANHFHLGAMMEKALIVKGGQLFCQQYLPKLRDLMLSGQPFTDPSFIITHRVPLDEIDTVYKNMLYHKDGIVKAVVYTDQSVLSSSGGRGGAGRAGAGQA